MHTFYNMAPIGVLAALLSSAALADNAPLNGFIVPSQPNTYVIGGVNSSPHYNVLTLDVPLATQMGGLGNTTGDLSGLNYSGATLSNTFCTLNANCTWSGVHLFGTDWLSSVIANTTANSTLSALSATGGNGVLGASHTSYYTSAGHMGTFGLSGFVLNDNATFMNTAYGLYVEARRNSGTGTTQGIETDIINEGTTVDVSPYTSLGTAIGLTAAYWASSGRGDVGASTTASTALGIIPNGAAFKRGVVFLTGSIALTGGVGEAISMAQGQQIAWYASDGNPAAYIWSSITGGYEGQALIFTNAGPVFQNSTGSALFTISAASGTVDGVTLTPGSIPIIGASGNDTNIALALRSKGIGSPVYIQSGALTAFEIATVSGGVNYLEALGSATNNAVVLQAQGTDATINISLKPVGAAGIVNIGGGGLQLPNLTVATLPSCVSTVAGSLAYVTDATTPTYNTTLVGSGSIKTLAMCNGSNWTAH